MRDANFLRENNAKQIWHPMAHPGEMREHPPRIVMKGEGVYVTEIDGRKLLDAWRMVGQFQVPSPFFGGKSMKLRLKPVSV